jgi:hypothetical protein
MRQTCETSWGVKNVNGSAQRELRFVPSHFSHLPLSIVCDIAGTWTQLNLKLDVSLVMNRGNYTGGNQ